MDLKNNSLINIFFSYSSEDKEYITLLKTLLKSIDKNDYIKYYDYVEMSEDKAKSNYDKINSQIKGCNLFIAILTPNYVKSTLCCWEAGLAFRENLITGRKNTFFKIAMLTGVDPRLELFHIFNNHYYFDKKGLSNLVFEINRKYNNILSNKDIITDDLKNLQKETENILLKKIIETKPYSENDKIKIKLLMK